MPTDEDVQEEILGVIIEAFRNQNAMVSLNGQSIIDEVTQSLSGVSDSDVEYQLRRLDDNFQIDFTPTTGVGLVELEAAGIERYEQLSGDVVVPQNHIKDILELLYEEERDNPRNPSLSRDELLQQTGLSEEELDRAIWYLKEKNFVDARTSIGQPWWHSAQITQSGRNIYEGL